MHKLVSRAAAAAVFFISTFAASAQVTYTWNQTGTASWATSTNWTPTRTTPAATDVLVFNNGATTTVTAVPAAQTIGQLSVSGNTNVTLQAAATSTVTIGGGTGTDLSVASGSQLNINTATALSLAVATGATGSISGSMTYSAGGHRLTSVDASGITFQSGSVFTAGTSFSGNPFGTTSLNSIIFASGSQYVAVAGSNPFGAGQPSSVVVFQTGSLYKNAGGGPAFSGRTYANFEQSSGTATVTGGSAVVMDNLTVSGGTLNFNMTATPGHAIKGNISVSAGATLTFNPASAGTVNLSGTSAQSISNAGTFSVSTANQTIVVNNANGVSLNSSIALANGTLTLTNGTVSTGANTLSIGSAASVTRTNGYVIGNLKKTYAATGSKVFEVGTANGYTPVTANVTAGTGDITAVAVQSAQPSMNASTSLQRYWTLTATGITADLTFQYLAGDVLGNESIYKVYRVSGGVPVFFAGSTVTPATHIATLSGVSSFSDWTAGEADLVPPTVTSVTVPADGTYVAGQNLDFTVNFSENVNVTGTPRIPITLNTGGTVYATYQLGTGSTALVFRYTVVNGNADPDGITVGGSFETNGGSIKDAAGNDATPALNSVGSTTNVLVDAVAPTVLSINRVESTPTNLGTVHFNVTFSEPVGGVDGGDFALATTGSVSGASIGLVTGTGATRNVEVLTGSGDGTIGLNLVDNDSITDPALNPLGGSGSGNGNFTGQVFAIDKTAPSVVSSARVEASPTNAATVHFTVTFSEAVTGVDASDFSLNTSGVSGASITGVSGSGPYTVTVDTGTGDGSIRLDVAANGSILDAAGNALSGAFTTGEVFTIDKTVPTVASINRAGGDPTHLTTLSFNVNFSANVNGVDSSDFVLAASGVTGSISGVTGSGSSYVVTVSSVSGNGSLGLNLVDNDSITSASTGTQLGGPGAGNGDFTGQVYTVDQIPPTVSSIVRVSGANSNASSVSFTVTYSEPVSGVSAQDWSLNTTGVSGASVTGFSGSGTTYTVNVNTGSGDGTIRLDVVTGGTVIDAAGNLLAAGFNTGEAYTIDKTPPAVLSINRADADPTSAASVNFTVTYSEPVSGVSAQDWSLNTTGVSGASVTGFIGSGTTYTVTVNTGTGTGTIRLDVVTGGTVIDAAGNLLAAGFNTGQSYTVQKAPLAPTGLAATPGDSHIALTWNAPNGAATYNVKRGLSTGAETTIASGIVATNYDDLTAVNGTTYFYVVTASNAQGEGPNSNEVSAAALAPVAPPSPVSIAVGDSKVILSWPNVVGATSYNVKRGTSTGNYTVTTNTPVPTFTDSTVVNGTTYFYVVTSVAASEGNPSSEVSGTPNTPQVLGVVVSQVYGGGGNAGATLKNDFVELFNRGTQTVSLSGWFVHYNSAASGTWTAPNSPTALSGTIAPGHYYLVQEAAGAGGTVNLPAADATGNIAMGATGGRIALVGSSAALSGCPTGTFIADFVGYGSAATCFEGAAPTGTTANTTAALRKNLGCTDTNNNGADFTVGAPNPRNSATAANICGVVNDPPSITPPANPIASVAQDAPPFTVNLTGSDDGGVYNWSATPGTGVSSVTVTGGQGTTTVTYTVSLVAAFNGTATFTATLSDGVNTAVNQTVNIQVTGVGGNNPPIITPPANPAATVAQDPAPFTVNISGTDDGAVYNWSATPGTGVSSVNVTGGQGTATVTYTVSLNAGFNGTATFTATLSDNVNPTVNQAVNINVLPAGGAPDHIVISQIYGGGGNSGATYKNDFVELYNPTASPVNISGWSVQYSSATNTGSFSGLQPLGGSIGPGEYYLIGLASGGAVGADIPTPNVSGSINMSGTTGKVALVNSGAVLSGPCSTTLATEGLIDLVGYGTANCNEGGTNAPAPSNTTSDFRKNGGLTDTNINGNDFITGTPNPRRTAGISEVGPAIVNTDPTTNGTNAPRDASIIVNFTEPVDVSNGWYNISCAVTGIHNDATVAPGAPDSYVITPNVNFQAAETCTVTIFKDFVHDTDTDDSAPGTDTLTADRTWSFTVATGAAAPYPPSVHLTMGNPSNAIADVSVPNNYLMQKPEFAISYSRDRGAPNWVSWHLSDEWVCCLTRVDTFRPDPQVPPTWYRVLASDFFSSGFDRGHMTPNADRNTSTSIPVNQATFLMSNMVAQAPGNNQGPWADLEGYLRTLLPANEVYIVSGPWGVGGTGSNGGVTNTLANGHVTVPAQTWKVALILPKASGDDVARVTASTRTLAVLMPNIDSIRSDDWHIYITTVDAVEALTGYDFFSNVPSAIQAAIEAGTDGVNKPGAGNESVTGAEDTAKPITLDGVSPTNAGLTYTIVASPAHGGLTGSGANRTYTPVPDYFGNDSFTYKVNDGSGDSNTATVTITVTPVNDPPTASNDSKNATTATPLTFPASDLTTNDSAGPASESGQTLTVTAVSPTGNTHGTVSLSAGQVTYTSDNGFTGAASFTYTVCDDGVTGSSFDTLCTAATVNVTVSGPLCPVVQVVPVTIPAGVCASSTGNHASINAVPGATTYAWQITNGTITAGQGTTNITFTAGASGNVQVSGSASNNTCLLATYSGQSTIFAIPTASIPVSPTITTCANSPVAVSVNLTGAPPFTITWDDGTVQSGINAMSASRTFTLTDSITVFIASVTDAHCNNGVASNGAHIQVNAGPAITQQPQTQSVKVGDTATFKVLASGNNLTYRWYQGPVGDTSTVVGTANEFTTPHLHEDTSYWVRVTNGCGTVDSVGVTADTYIPRRRPSSH